MNKVNDAQKLTFAYLSRSFGIRQSKDERIIQERMFFFLREARNLIFRLSSVGRSPFFRLAITIFIACASFSFVFMIFRCGIIRM